MRKKTNLDCDSFGFRKSLFLKSDLWRFDQRDQGSLRRTEVDLEYCTYSSLKALKFEQNRANGLVLKFAFVCEEWGVGGQIWLTQHLIDDPAVTHCTAISRSPFYHYYNHGHEIRT